MTDSSDNKWMASSDSAVLKTIGSFIRHNRLLQNKTQGQLAKEAGIVRSTLSLFERGENTSLLIFIQLLRALKLLHLLKEFQIIPRISPIQLAKLERSERLRARSKNPIESKPKSDW